ncbi:hypothetical protein MG293_001734 [Ovis ammon polii]|uniref:Uncharacterized protein n=1 Tax=Ovis ammon polii TaxID=230172 RepID=A0AAD4UQJ7_OVIAM|nr:hypothetical protein MG293_001734 [Ovis ammon polii]
MSTPEKVPEIHIAKRNLGEVFRPEGSPEPARCRNRGKAREVSEGAMRSDIRVTFFLTSPYRTIAQWLIDKESVCNAEDVEHEFDPWDWKRESEMFLSLTLPVLLFEIFSFLKSEYQIKLFKI